MRSVSWRRRLDSRWSPASGQSRHRHSTDIFAILRSAPPSEHFQNRAAGCEHGLCPPPLSLVAWRSSITVSERALDEAFAEMDPNGDGSVDLDEFRDWYNKRVAEGGEGDEEEDDSSKAVEMAAELARQAETGDLITTLRNDAMKEKVCACVMCVMCAAVFIIVCVCKMESLFV